LSSLKRKTPTSTKETALLPPRYDLVTTASKASLYREQSSLLSDFGTSTEQSLHSIYDDWCLRVSEAEKQADNLLRLGELKKDIGIACERLAEVRGKAMQVADVVREHQEVILAGKFHKVE
jgi:hypothetical protein